MAVVAPPHHRKRPGAHAARAGVSIFLPRHAVLGRLVLLPAVMAMARARGLELGLGLGLGLGLTLALALALTCHEA